MSNSGGSDVRHRSRIPARAASGQRGWNRQPVGIAAALGVSPTRIWRLARSAGQKLAQLAAGLEGHALLASLVVVIVLAAAAWIW